MWEKNKEARRGPAESKAQKASQPAYFPFPHASSLPLYLCRPVEVLIIGKLTLQLHLGEPLGLVQDSP